MRYSDDMPRWFIDAKELWKRLIEVRQFNKGLDIPYTVNLGINQAIGELNSLPAADVVEVVRCKNCRWFDKTGFEEYNAPEEDLSLHSGWCKSWRKGTQACVFCSYGERKDDA